MWLLVTGTGRCGTGYIAQVLTSAGVECGHQKVFNLGGWEGAMRAIQDWEAESSWLAAPFLDRPELDELTVVHLIRHPKKVMDSFLRLILHDTVIDDPYYDWARGHLPELDDYDNGPDRAACWYLGFNEMVENLADLRHRIEDDVMYLLDQLGIDWQGCELFRDTAYNSMVAFGPSDVQPEDVSQPLRDQLARMSKRYGYDWF